MSKITNDDVLRLLKKYNIGKAERIKVVRGGIINYNFNVKTDKGRFIVRFMGGEIDKRKKKKLDLKFKVLNYLKKEKFPYKTPTPIKNNEGKHLTRLGEKTAWIYERIDGKTVAMKSLNEKQINEIIKAMATYHKFLGEKNWGKWDPDLSWLMKKYDEMEKIKSRKPIDKLVLNNIDFFKSILKRLLKRKFNKNIIPVHTDMHQGNVLFDGDKVVAIIDFGNIELGPRVKDVAYLILHFGLNNRKIDKVKRNKLFREYNRINKLTVAEKKEIINCNMEYNCIVFWWNYAEMKQRLDRKYAWLRNAIEMNKDLEKMR